MSLVWLITGCSTGLGLCIARAALQAGHKVIATSRRPEKTPKAVAEITSNENGAWIQLDVTAPDIEKRLDECTQRFGRIDVLVNNAGYALGGPLEDCTVEDIRRQMETNFFGPVRVMKALIPHFREQGSGTIINITSTEGISAMPGITMYAASKHALEAVSEGLQQELAAFNIRVLIVEPGGMRTSFLDEANVVQPSISKPYKGGAADQILRYVTSTAGQQALDPVRSAQRIVENVSGGGKGWPEYREQFLRLPLGTEAAGRVKTKTESLKSNLNAMEQIWKSVEFEC